MPQRDRIFIVEDGSRAPAALSKILREDLKIPGLDGIGFTAIPVHEYTQSGGAKG